LSWKAIRERPIFSLGGHALVYASGRVIPAASALGTIALLSRALLPDEFGRFILAFSLGVFWANIGTVWLGQGILRFHTRFQTGRLSASYVGFSRRARWLCAGMGALGAGTAAVIAGAPLSVAGSSAALAAVEATVLVAIATGQARLRPAVVAVTESAKGALGLLGMAAVVVLRPDPSAPQMIWAAAGGGVLALALFRWFRLEGESGPERSRATRAVRTAMLRYGIPIAAFSLLSQALNMADRFLIARWKGLAQAGAYAGVYDTVYRSFGLFLFPVLLAAQPQMTRAWNAGDRLAAQRAARMALSLEVAIGVPVVLALAAAHGHVVRYALGVSLDRSFELVLTVGLAALLWQLAQIVHMPSALSGRLGVLVVGVLLALAINCGANLLLLPRSPMVVAGYTSALATAGYFGFVLLKQRSKTSWVAAPTARHGPSPSSEPPS
jgi:O-antigen/teichoic acid export membrane protein